MNRFRTLFTFLLCMFGFVACGSSTRPAAPPKAADTLKVAFVYVGPVGDAGWTWAHDQGRKDLEATYSWVDTAYLESVPEGAEAERVLTQFAEKGYKLIFATSFGYMDAVIKVAERYPDVVFMHCSGYKRAPNVGTYFGRMYEATWLTGLVAGGMSKSNIIGVVAPHPIPEVIRHTNAFALGVREANPKASVKVVWTNSWFDPGREKEAALSMIDAGADVIATGADSAAPLQGAEERGKLAIGYDSDTSRFAPNAFLTAAIWDWTITYRDIVKKVHDGTWASADSFEGLSSGLVKLAPISDKVPAELKARVEAETADIKLGRRVIFAGPVSRQDGSPGIPEGRAATDAELLSMDWFVQGVEGIIPK